MDKAQMFLRKHSSTILTIIGATGVIATSVLAVKATPKALKLIENEKQRREQGKTIFNNDEISYERVIVPDLTPMEIVKIAWKPYIPAVITGVSTIACIFGANYLSVKSQASLMSAYALLDNYHKEYRDKTRALYKEDADKFEHEIIKSKFDPEMDLDEDKELFYDMQAMRYFQSTFEEVKNAEYVLNKKLNMDGFACLNDFYEILGEKPVPYGYQLGWSTISSDKSYGDNALRFEYDKAEITEGLECNIVTITYPSSLEYIC